MKNYLKTLMFALVGVFAFSSCEDVPAPYPMPTEGGNSSTVVTPEGDGTATSPFNVAKLRELIDDNQAPTGEIYIKGKVSQIKSLNTAQYTRAQYYISDDGSTTNQFYVYNGLYLNGDNFTSDDQLKVGDEVVILGTLTTYNNQYQVNQNSKIVSLNGQGNIEPETPADPVGSGTETDPYNVAKIKQLINEGNVPTGEIYIKGIISQIKSLDVEKYTRAQYYISDSGKTGDQFYVYNGLYLGGANFTANDQIKVGDQVVILGTLGTYQDEYQVAQNSKIVELNGQKASDTPTPTPTGTPEGEGTATSPWNVAAVVKAYADNASFYNADTEYYVKGVITNVATFNSNYGSISYYISDDTSASNSFYVYSGLSLESNKFSSKNDLKVGDQVVVCGKFTVYQGTFEFQYNNYLVSLNGITDPNDLPDSGTDTNTEGNSITFSAMGYQNQQDFNNQPITLGDATLTFSKGSGSTTPKYYNTGTAMRMYGGNTLTISSSKNISKIEFTYGEDYNGTSYYPTADNSTVEPGNYDYSTHTWTGSAKEIVLTRTATTGHFRIVTITITYAE